MTFSDYLIDISLIAVVLLQVRGRRLTLRSLLLPLAICAWAASNYLHGIPTAGNDVPLLVIGAGVGITLGALAGLWTKVTAGADGHPFAQAGLLAGILWVAGVGSRFAFQLYASHGGAGAIARFSAAHTITSSKAWVAALLFMAIGEALARTTVVAFRGYRVAPEQFLRRESMIGTGGPVY